MLEQSFFILTFKLSLSWCLDLSTGTRKPDVTRTASWCGTTTSSSSSTKAPTQLQWSTISTPDFRFRSVSRNIVAPPSATRRRRSWRSSTGSSAWWRGRSTSSPSAPTGGTCARRRRGWRPRPRGRASAGVGTRTTTWTPSSTWSRGRRGWARSVISRPSLQSSDFDAKLCILCRAQGRTHSVLHRVLLHKVQQS